MTQPENRLFDSSPRTRTGFKRDAEPNFTYYNESSRDELQALREMLETWYASLPDDAKPDVRSRFRARDDVQHAGAFLELYVHELLTGMGFGVELHPEVPGTTRQPDFLVTRHGVPCFYAECRAVGPPKEVRAQEARLNQALNALRRLYFLDFELDLEVDGAPQSPVPARRLASDIRRWVGNLNAQRVLEEATNLESADLPQLGCFHDGLRIHVIAVPRAHDERGTAASNSAVRSIMTEMHEVDDYSPIRAAVVRKGKQYRHLQLPYVLFLNTIRERIHRFDIWNALFGNSGMRYQLPARGGLVAQPYRRPNGAWVNGDGPRYTKISGVFLGVGLGPWSSLTQSPTLMHHPWAAHRLDPTVWPLAQEVPNDSTQTYTLRIPVDPDRRFRPKAIADSGDGDRRFRPS